MNCPLKIGFNDIGIAVPYVGWIARLQTTTDAFFEPSEVSKIVTPE